MTTVLALKPGHDGAVAAIRDGRLLFSYEAEKDSGRRYSPITAATILEAAAELDEMPDVVALGGWGRRGDNGKLKVGAGYAGHDFSTSVSRFFGKRVKFFSSTHERSHFAAALGLSPAPVTDREAVLVWEGEVGSLAIVDAKTAAVLKYEEVWQAPGARYASVFAIADPTFLSGSMPRFEDAGKLMALAAYGDATKADPKLIENIMWMPLDDMYPFNKDAFMEFPVWNSGVASTEAVNAAAAISLRLFQEFDARLPYTSIPLRIAGGCGLNCDWNGAWRATGRDVFVPPVANDSGSAIGTAIDAWWKTTGQEGARIEWDVYSGQEFHADAPMTGWEETDAWDLPLVLSAGEVVAYVRGRCEIGPRALCHRSLLASPFKADMLTRLNRIKRRESYRPIAPVCAEEFAGALFDSAEPDPYMLYFRRVRSGAKIPAVTHVDGTSRVQTVSQFDDPELHKLLWRFASISGTSKPILCNTSLNFPGFGFINSTSDLLRYCEREDINYISINGRLWRKL
jgi:hydroxymethyl cephem carbamoyltransferase